MSDDEGCGKGEGVTEEKVGDEPATHFDGEATRGDAPDGDAPEPST